MLGKNNLRPSVISSHHYLICARNMLALFMEITYFPRLVNESTTILSNLILA